MAKEKKSKSARSDNRTVLWKELPDQHDYPAARDYLQLVATPVQVQALVYALKTATLVTKKAKDILRAAGLPLLPVDNPHVASDLKKIRKGIALSPILVVQGDFRTGVPMQIADGYHRVCASYHVDENTAIPLKLAPSTTVS
ncbi:hypothetical protein ABH922_001752 [Rhodococcus sp. 27YEA15]|uniref:hypothetical protein n=1 Tax=Rhodococcus sp. 27YEA15 TaxID=3156259 RepID=UPI003C7B9C3B